MMANPELWAFAPGDAAENLLRELAVQEGCELRVFRGVAEAVHREEPPGGVVIAIGAGDSPGNYLAAVKRFQKSFFKLSVISFGPPKSADGIERDRDAGVDLSVALPIDRDEFIVNASRLVALRRLKSAAGIVGRSRSLDEVLDTVLQVAPTDVAVLIVGESGSGKELLARAIHLASARHDRSFEAINCGALAEGVLESELFGHEKGSFTGAVARRQGLFERANKGTLLLDEVGEMSLGMQVRLMRVIETGEFLRVGGGEKVSTNVRIIAATNRELETAVERGLFRKDLYYRLRVVQMRIPPLRSRPEDVATLARYFLAESSRRHGRAARGIDREGMRLLTEYSWPGNVRELANVIDNLSILGGDRVIGAPEIEKRLRERMTTGQTPDLPIPVQRTREELERELLLNAILSLHNDIREILRILKGAPPQAPPGQRWRSWVEVSEAGAEEGRSLTNIERDAIREALAASGGNRRAAARRLGISERTLYRRIKEYRLA